MDIYLTLKNYRCFPESEPAHITISDGWTAFVGVNNAGKSAILRMIYEFRDYFRVLSENTNAHVHPGSIIIQHARFPVNVHDIDELINSSSDKQLSIQVAVGLYSKRSEITLAINRDVKSLYVSTFNDIAISESAIIHKLSITDALNSDTKPDSASLFKALGLLANTLYIGASRNILNTGGNGDYFDIRTGDAFVKRWRQMQTGSVKTENTACRDVVAAIERLLRCERLEIQSSDDATTLHVAINGNPYRLNEVGSGIAQLILVLASVAIAKPSYILIDEPELNLHPSLQLEFLSELGKFATHGMLFSTHNIGLARSSADRIYSILRVAEGHSQVVQYERTPNLPEFLGALSYSSYQALGFDKVLLVEGVTEVRTVQQLLRKLKKDHRILLLPLGGGQLISANREAELAEIRRITPRVSVLIDSERMAAGAELEPGRKAFIDACKKLDFDCCVIERRATENYLTQAAIRKVKGEKYSALSPFVSLKEMPIGWAKSDNWRIAAEMDVSDFSDTDLGKFLESL